MASWFDVCVEIIWGCLIRSFRCGASLLVGCIANVVAAILDDDEDETWRWLSPSLTRKPLSTLAFMSSMLDLVLGFALVFKCLLILSSPGVWVDAGCCKISDGELASGDEGISTVIERGSSILSCSQVSDSFSFDLWFLLGAIARQL